MSDVLLLVDVMNRFDFPEGPALVRQLKAKVPAIVRLKQRFHAAGRAVVYANDNEGQWRSDFAAQVQRCVRDGAPGADIARSLAPDAPDYFVLKPHLSAFFGTPLRDLLDTLQCRRLVIAGLATDACVLATAIDAHMRKYDVHVPRDCVVAPTPARTRAALLVMQRALQIPNSAAATIRLRATARRRG